MHKSEVISRPATNMLNKIMDALPNIFMAVAILVVTFYVIRMVCQHHQRFDQNTQIDQLPAKVGFVRNHGHSEISDLVGYAIVFFAMLFASTAAADLLVLNLSQPSSLCLSLWCQQYHPGRDHSVYRLLLTPISLLGRGAF